MDGIRGTELENTFVPAVNQLIMSKAGCGGLFNSFRIYEYGDKKSVRK